MDELNGCIGTERRDGSEEMENRLIIARPLHSYSLSLRLVICSCYSLQLWTCLYNFTSPGSTMYPTTTIRLAAWDALDGLFLEDGTRGRVWGEEEDRGGVWDKEGGRGGGGNEKENEERRM
ncbi:hypothetical protein KSS87_013277 [Heliosperma pusillum]|nr:hypothetical protein KSS87_013277 [Heliosperma pusillum]